MTASTITVKNAAGMEKELATDVDGSGVHTPKHREDDAQRAELLEALAPLLDVVATRLSPDQDPIFDHDNGTLTTIVADAVSVTILTPPAGCKYARIGSDVDCFIRTDSTGSADDAKSIRIIANQPETIPVTPGIAVKAFAKNAANVRATPMKVRP